MITKERFITDFFKNEKNLDLTDYIVEYSNGKLTNEKVTFFYRNGGQAFFPLFSVHSILKDYYLKKFEIQIVTDKQNNIIKIC